MPQTRPVRAARSGPDMTRCVVAGRRMCVTPPHTEPTRRRPQTAREAWTVQNRWCRQGRAKGRDPLNIRLRLAFVSLLGHLLYVYVYWGPHIVLNILGSTTSQTHKHKLTDFASHYKHCCKLKYALSHVETFCNNISAEKLQPCSTEPSESMSGLRRYRSCRRPC